MNRTPLPLTTITDHLQQNEPFSLSRWGDGEFVAMFKPGTMNADGVKLDKGLGKQLMAVLKQNQPYYHGLLRIALTYHKDNIETRYKDFTWYNGDMLLNQFLEGKGKPLIEQLRQKKILYIGPSHCRQLNKDFFEYRDFIEVSGSEAHKNSKVHDILTAVRKHDIEVIGYSAGPASNLWINQLYSDLKDHVTQIDFGSMWDGFFNVKSRSYMKNVDFEQLLKDST